MKQVFSRIPYVVLSIIVFLGVLVLAIWLPNISFLAHTITSDIFTLSQKVGIISGSLEAIQTNFTPLSRVLTVLIALLFSINTSFFIFYVLRASQLSRSAGVGAPGFLLGLFGIGCASCGSVLLSSFFGIGATASFLGFLPLKGQEFGLLSIAILTISIFLLAKKIKDPLVCRTKPKKFPLWSKVLSFIILAFFVGVLFAKWNINR